MTTTVTILIAGNKKCVAKVVEANGTDSTSYPERIVMPGSFTTVCVSGEQAVSVKETGDFLS